MRLRPATAARIAAPRSGSDVSAPSVGAPRGPAPRDPDIGFLGKRVAAAENIRRTKDWEERANATLRAGAPDGRRGDRRYFSTATSRHSGGNSAILIGGLAGPGRGCSASSVNHQARVLSQPSPGGTGSWGWQAVSPSGQRMRM